MFLLCLSLTIAAEPIPKVGDYEGSIFISINRPEKSLLRLTPSGNERSRTPLKTPSGYISAIRMGRNASTAFVETQDEEVEYLDRITLIDLEGNARPKIILKKATLINWVVNCEATAIYGSEIDHKNLLPGIRRQPMRHWKYDLSAKTYSKIDLPSNCEIADIAHRDDSLLTNSFQLNNEDVKDQTVIYSIKGFRQTFKTDAMSGDNVSPDGKYLLVRTFIRNPKGEDEQKFVVLDTKTRTKKVLKNPVGTDDFMAYAFGTKNRIVVISRSFEIEETETDHYRVFVINIDDSKAKLIYESKAGEDLDKCEWR